MTPRPAGPRPAGRRSGWVPATLCAGPAAVPRPALGPGRPEAADLTRLLRRFASSVLVLGAVTAVTALTGLTTVAVALVLAGFALLFVLVRDG